jgi:hypothetical protein
MRLGAGTLATAVGDAVAPFGLNLVGVARPATYDALVPAPYRLRDAAGPLLSVVVIGNGGDAFWSAFRAHVRRHPDFAARPHPLDDFTRTVMEEAALPALARHGVAGVLRFPFDRGEPSLSFVHLAEAAGLGCRSLLGVLVHPEFGPWMALRGALLLDVAMSALRPAAGFEPCAACVERPCVGACPTGAVTASGWDVERCASYRLGSAGRCDEACHARVACVYGRAHRYPTDAIAYHQGRARAVMEQRRGAPPLSGPAGS